MACSGSNTLRRSKTHRSIETRDVPEDDDPSNLGSRRRMLKKDARKCKGSLGAASDRAEADRTSKKKKTNEKKKGRERGRRGEASDRKFEKNPDVVSHKSAEDGKSSSLHAKQLPVLRKKVDPETAKYFSEIANLFESNAIDLEERPSVCANALDEARGKELELATDMVISHTLQTLLEGCDPEQVCGFLQGCADDFSSIAMDRYGSHVVETALKSLSAHLRNTEAVTVIEDILTKLCKVVSIDPVNMMCNCYGSHVVRSLLCLCKGMPLDSLEEFHSTKTSVVLAGRLNIKKPHHNGDKLHGNQQAFPDLLKHFILEMLRHAGTEIKAIRVDKYGSFVLQAALKSLVGDDRELTNAIFFLLGCSEENISEGLPLESAVTQETLGLLENTAASHLMEVILEVAPDNLYDEILQKIFRGSLYEISSHQCGNFAVQALISSARNKGQVDLIWEELGLKMKELLDIGKAGVIASLLAACHRIETHGQECCKVLAHAVQSENEHSSSIVPRLLFLDSFSCCKDKSTWQWPLDNRMHVLGCLMLQTVFKFPNQCMQQYARSLVSMETDRVLRMAEDAGGSRVLESFLCSDASAKVKLKVISKFQGHFGELSLHPSGSFMVEKCFAASNLAFRETIVTELATVKDELSKTKHGPHVIRNLDIDGYTRWPEQWKSSQAAKDAIYREFQAAFGSHHKDGKALASPPFDSSRREKIGKGRKRPRSQDESCTGEQHNLLPTGPKFPGLELSMAKLGFSDFKHAAKHGRKAGRSESTSQHPNKKFIRNPIIENCFIRRDKKRKSSSSELADLASKRALSSGDVRKLFDSNTAMNQKKQRS